MKQGKPSWTVHWWPDTRIQASESRLWEIDLFPGRSIPTGSVLRLLLNHPRIEWSIGEFFFSTNAECRFQERILYEGWDRIPILECEITEGRICKNDRIKILLGDYSGKGRQAIAPKIADVTAPAIFQVKIPPSRRFTVVAEIALTYLPARPSRLNLRAVSPSSSGPLIVAAVDAFDNAAAGLANVVRVVSSNGSQPREIARLRLAKGKAVLRNWKNTSRGKKGPWLLRAESDGGIASETAVVVPGFYRDLGRNVYFGDMHLHSSGSHDGLHSPSWAYNYARNVAGLAFCSITDHVYHLRDNGSWKQARQAAQEAYVPGKFVTFLGYEYDGHSEKGHLGVHFRDDVPRLIVSDSIPSLWKRLRASGLECFTCAHHPNVAAERLPLAPRDGWGPYHWEYHDEVLQPLAEMVQERGIFESESAPARTDGGYGASLQSALRRGYHIGFLGGSDTHLGRPGTPSFSHWRRTPVEMHTGLTAVLAEKLTRDSLWQAMKSRHTYATTGTRMLLDVRVNGWIMGDRVVLSEETAVRIRIRAAAPYPIRQVFVVKNGRIFAEFSPRTYWMDRTLEDQTPFAAFLPCVAEQCEGHSYYYVHVVQEDGHQAWSSPVFLCRRYHRRRREFVFVASNEC